MPPATSLSRRNSMKFKHQRRSTKKPGWYLILSTRKIRKRARENCRLKKSHDKCVRQSEKKGRYAYQIISEHPGKSGEQIWKLATSPVRLAHRQGCAAHQWTCCWWIGEGFCSSCGKFTANFLSNLDQQQLGRESRWNCCGAIQLRALAFFPLRCHRFRKAAWHSHEPRHQFCVYLAPSFTCFTYLESVVQAPPWVRSRGSKNVKKWQKHSKCLKKKKRIKK